MIDDLNILGCSEEDSYDDLVFKNGKLLYAALATQEKLKNLISEYIIKKDIKDIGSQLPKLLCIPIYVDLDEKQVQMHNKILEDIDEIKKEILRIKDNKLNLFEKIIDNNKEEKTSQKNFSSRH